MKLPFFSLLSCAEIAENAQKIANITDFLLRIIFFRPFSKSLQRPKSFSSQRILDPSISIKGYRVNQNSHIHE